MDVYSCLSSFLLVGEAAQSQKEGLREKEAWPLSSLRFSC